MGAVAREYGFLFPTYVGMNRAADRHDKLDHPVPHVRGDEPALALGLRKSAELFPTYVGMNRQSISPDGTGGSVPHVRGDEPTFMQIEIARLVCSPRTWG